MCSSKRFIRRQLTIPLFALLLAWSSAAIAIAQEAPSAKTAETAEPAQVEPKPELKSPRATIRTFLSAMKEGTTEEAIECLDLSYITSNVAEASGPNIAHQLKTAFDRTVGLTVESPEEVWQEIPDENDFGQRYSLASIPGSIPAAKDLIIARGEDGNWQFTPETCRSVEQAFDELEQLPTLVEEEQTVAEADVPLPIQLRQWFPENFRETRFLLPDYQWICLLVVTLLAVVADLFIRYVATLIADHWLATTSDETGPETTKKIWRPLGHLACATVLYFGTTLIGFSSVALNVLLVILKLFSIVAAVWTSFAVIDLVGTYWSRRARATQRRFDDLLVPLVSKTLKLFAICLGLLTAAQTFDMPIVGLIGGLGIGGAALALASKDAVANFFGSVTVLFDRPFEVGDWIITDGAEGTVEAVGFRSTRIRTFYNSMITLPNSLLTTSVVDNMGRRRFRRVKTTLGVQYNTTPAQLDAFCEGIRELIRQHPYTRKDYFHVYFNDFGSDSLDIMLYCFLVCPDWGIELRERHRLLADIIRLAHELGVQFAFPTRTVHLSSDEPNDIIREISAPQEEGRQLAAKIAGKGSQERQN